jgi:hypothetical protein
MVDWGNLQDTLDISYSVMEAVSTFQQSSVTPDKQPLNENPHYRRLNDHDEFEILLNNLCESSTCPLCREVENGCEYLYLDSYDIDNFIATLEADNENPYEW